jgi:hypothetical protein
MMLILRDARIGPAQLKRGGLGVDVHVRPELQREEIIKDVNLLLIVDDDFFHFLSSLNMHSRR